ncbi:MAG TPA: DUF4148 domain-containing protein [Paraburkholderia sp.]|jgi:hypothetical protein|nr:DUF4148 domain-containing protein [Paraburkholderia sp.]
MRYLPRLLAVALVSATCAYAYADTSPYSNDPSAPKTRAQVIADLAEWRAAGYDPNDWIDYPENAIAAGRIVAERRAAHAASSPSLQ